MASHWLSRSVLVKIVRIIGEGSGPFTNAFAIVETIFNNHFTEIISSKRLRLEIENLQNSNNLTDHEKKKLRELLNWLKNKE